jgi:hypothetical protein
MTTTTRSTCTALTALLLGTIMALAPGRTGNAGTAGPPRESVAPRIALNDLHGAAVSTDQFSGRPLVLVFGDLGHDGCRQACAAILDELADELGGGLDPSSALPILITAQAGVPAELRDQAAKGRFPPLILLDPSRDAFGAYRIVVVPTVVIVSSKGKVVHSMPGFIPRFQEILAESLLVANGRHTAADLDRCLGLTGDAAPDSESLRAARLVHLGDELVRHGLDEMAEARYTEALVLAPGNLEATIGLASLKSRLGKLDEAEALFREVLKSQAESVEASLGIAELNLSRGGEALARAEADLKALLESHPKLPRGHYLLGRLHEVRGRFQDAAAEYRAAVELLLKKAGSR